MPRDTLTREYIVTVAVDLLDADGLEGLNMRALGRRLDSAATTVYWHVGSKDNLIALAGDRVWHEITLPDLDLTDWRTAATAMATDLYAMLIRHPWLLQAFGSFLMSGPGKARHDDHLLAIYEAAGFTGAQADQAAATVFTFVLGNALGPAAKASLTRELGRDGGDAEKAMRDTLAKASHIAAQFPRLRTRLHARKAHYGAAPDNTFDFGLHTVLDGLETVLSSRRSRTNSQGDPTMWRYEHTAQAPVSPEAVWRLWSEVELWPDWNPDIETITIDGPFAAGSKFVMNPDSAEAVHMTLEEVVPGTSFTDLAEFGGLMIRTIHLLEPAEGGDVKITYAMEITGPDADTTGAEVGEQITSDFPETIAALLKHAAR